jgi:hypothetical protein
MIVNQFQTIAIQANQLQREFEQGLLTEDEFKELIGNIGALQAIHEDTANLEENLVYREMIINAINIAKALA